MTTATGIILAVLALAAAAVATYYRNRVKSFEAYYKRSGAALDAVYDTWKSLQDGTPANHYVTYDTAAMVWREMPEMDDIVIAYYDTDDPGYNRILAEELCEMLNRRP